MASPHPTSSSDITPASIIKWVLLILLALFLLFFYLFVDFKGLSHQKGMEQAQIAREIARGHQFTTKVVKPLALYQINEHRKKEDERDKGAPLIGLRDTYHAPLNPLLNSIIMRFFRTEPDANGDDGLRYVPENAEIFYLDYVIAGISMLMLLGAVGMSYQLASHIFDRKIGALTALLMLLCQLLWQFAQSGLPQPLMLFLFSFALYFLYRATENVNLGRSPYMWAVLSALFFGLLALAHWISVWIFVGALFYAAFFLRPRGMVAAAMLGVYLFIVIWWPLLVNLPATGNPLGSGFYQFYAGLSGGSEAMVFRNFNPDQIQISPDGGLLRKIASGTIFQLAAIFSLMGGVLAAPLFFLSLLHPFKRAEIAQFRWGVLLMWVGASVGMSIFGLMEEAKDPNQLHVLFIPVMAAYGLAFLAVLWSRLSLPSTAAWVRNGHFIIVTIVSGAPLLLNLPWQIAWAIAKDRKFNYPPYIPPLYAPLSKVVAENQVIASDAPWAVAWYADRTSLWLPRTRSQLDAIYKSSKEQRYPVVGIMLTPIATHQNYASNIIFRGGEYGEWAPLIENFSMRKNYGTSTLPAMGEDFPFKTFSPMSRNMGDHVYFSEGAGLK